MVAQRVRRLPLGMEVGVEASRDGSLSNDNRTRLTVPG